MQFSSSFCTSSQRACSIAGQCLQSNVSSFICWEHKHRVTVSASNSAFIAQRDGAIDKDTQYFMRAVQPNELCDQPVVLGWWIIDISKFAVSNLKTAATLHALVCISKNGAALFWKCLYCVCMCMCLCV